MKLKDLTDDQRLYLKQDILSKRMDEKGRVLRMASWPMQATLSPTRNLKTHTAKRSLCQKISCEVCRVWRHYGVAP